MPRLQKRYRKGSDGRKRLVGIAAVFYDPDRRPTEKYISLHTLSSTLARRKLKLLEDRVLEGWDPWKNKMPNLSQSVSWAIQEYIDSRSDRREKSLRADESTLSRFARHLPPHIPVSAVEERHVRNYVRDDLSAATQRTYLTRLSTFFDWCISESYCRSNPVRKIKKPKLSRKEKLFLTRDQVQKIIRCIESEAVLKDSTLKEGELLWMSDVILLAVGTGLRVSELCALRWSAVNLTNRRITVRVTEHFITKSGHERGIPVRGQALDVLRQLSMTRSSESDDFVFASRRGRDGDKAGLNPEYVSKRFKHFARLAKMPEGTSFHTLRHTYISWLVMEGIPIPVVKELAGHADITTTMGYAHLSPESLSAAVEKVFQLSSVT